MNQSVLKLTPSGRPLGVSLGFGARAVVVDNYTSSYVLLPDAGKTIPPWTYGAVVTLPPEGVRQARASLVPTVPAVPGPPVPVSETALTWTDQLLSADPGHLLQQSQYTNRQKLYPDGVAIPVITNTPSFTVGAGATVTKTFTLPAGTVEIRILATASGLLFAYSLLVSGRQTVEQYFGDPNAPGTAVAVPVPTLPFTIPVELDWDTQVDLTVVGDPVRVVSLFVSALTAAEAPGQAGAASSVTVLGASAIAPRKFDWFVSGSFDGAVGAPSLSNPAPGANLASQLAAYTCSVINSVATGYVGTVAFADANPATIWRDALGIPAVANSVDRAQQTGLGAFGAKGSAITMSLNNAIPANVFVRMSMGGYYS